MGFEIDEIDQGRGNVCGVEKDADLASRAQEREHSNLLLYRREARESTLPLAG